MNKFNLKGGYIDIKKFKEGLGINHLVPLFTKYVEDYKSVMINSSKYFPIYYQTYEKGQKINGPTYIKKKLEDRTQNLIDFIKNDGKVSIWKDPKTELPAKYSRIVVKYMPVGYNVGDAVLLSLGYYNEYGYREHKGETQFHEGKVLEWCYEEDLIKQAKGDSDE